MAKEYHQAHRNIAEGVISFFQKTFTRFDVQGPELDPSFIRDSAFMVPSTHRSHADYFIVGKMLFTKNIPNMRFAAGDNLTNLPVIGPRYRSLGAFTVKRGSRFDRSYLKRLREQVVTMLHDGDTVVVFPEGGRSYSGGMLDIKSGILGAAVVAQSRGSGRPLYFLPVAVSYECLPELQFFDMIRKGKALRTESKSWWGQWRGNICYFGADLIAFAQFLSANRIGRQYGEVYVDYCRPISISEALEQGRGAVNADARDEFSRYRPVIDDLSGIIYRRFCELYRLLPMHVVAFLVKTRGITSRRELLEAIPEITQRLHSEKRNMRSLSQTSAEIAERGIAQLRRMQGIRVKQSSISVRKRFVVDYYAAALT